MAAGSIKNVRIAGMASAVPVGVRTLDDDAKVFGSAEIERISQNIGVRRRHVVSDGMCASDLCFAAADRLLDELGWERDSVSALLFVSQTPDAFMPATACTLQHRLGLAKHCAAFDVNQGCAGYVYGLWLAAQMAAGGTAPRVLLLVGDTISRVVSPEDRTVTSLFGDAGAATAVEFDGEGGPMQFELGADGGGGRHLCIPAGAFRLPHSPDTARREMRENENRRSEEDLFMDGGEVFTFSLREAPALVKRTLGAAGESMESLDAVVFHQANQFMLGYLAKRLRAPADKVVMGLADYGNTSCASIPLAMTTELRNRLTEQALKLLLVGFGAGFAWGAVTLDCGPLCMPELIEVA